MTTIFNTTEIHRLSDTNNRRLRLSKLDVVTKYIITLERSFTENYIYKKVDTLVHVFTNYTPNDTPSLIYQLSILDDEKIATCVILRQYTADSPHKVHIIGTHP